MARVKITETVLRDGHQSIAATRMRINQMIPVLEAMDEIGYHAVECWGRRHLRFMYEVFFDERSVGNGWTVTIKEVI